MTRSQIFIIGERRSGTNLLRLVLAQHPDISAPHMVGVLQRMIPLSDAYGDPSDPAVLRQMIADVRELIALGPVAWTGPALDVDALERNLRGTSFIAILSAVMDLSAEADGAGIWVNKEANALQWFEQLKSELADVRFIYLYRDPRDVCYSFSNIAHGEKHPYFQARQWVQMQQACLTNIDRVPDTVHFVKYEDLVSDPESVVRGICRFFDVPFDTRMLQQHRSSEASHIAQGGAHWANLDRPITAAAVAKYRGNLSDYDIAIIESLAGPVMDRLGYPRDVLLAGSEIVFSPEQIAVFLEENRSRKEKALAALSPERWERSGRQRALLESIRQRGS
jgi:hypothetical protein